MRTGRLDHGCVAGGGRRFHSWQDGRDHRPGHRDLDHGTAPALDTGIGAQGLELGDGLVVQHVSGAAGGPVRQEGDENRHAEGDGQPDVHTSPHLADRMRLHLAHVKWPREYCAGGSLARRTASASAEEHAIKRNGSSPEENEGEGDGDAREGKLVPDSSGTGAPQPIGQMHF